MSSSDQLTEHSVSEEKIHVWEKRFLELSIEEVKRMGVDKEFDTNHIPLTPYSGGRFEQYGLGYIIKFWLTEIDSIMSDEKRLVEKHIRPMLKQIFESVEKDATLKPVLHTDFSKWKSLCTYFEESNPSDSYFELQISAFYQKPIYDTQEQV
jgi:hypothetical protein